MTTDENGRFAFAKVPPGMHRLVRLVKHQDGGRTIWSHQPLEEVEIRSGETTQVTVGGASYSVTARLRWPQDLKRDPAWTVNASLHTSVPPPPEDARTNPQALAEWQALPAVKAAMRNMRHFALTENAEGVFSAEDIPSGQYTFAVSVFEPPTAPGPVTMHARGDAPVNIPSDPPSGTVDVGRYPEARAVTCCIASSRSAVRRGFTKLGFAGFSPGRSYGLPRRLAFAMLLSLLKKYDHDCEPRLKPS